CCGINRANSREGLVPTTKAPPNEKSHPNDVTRVDGDPARRHTERVAAVFSGKELAVSLVITPPKRSNEEIDDHSGVVAGHRSKADRR
ncbi:MAG: hypothetical protein ACJAXA_003795, partial [Candidatus Aldehydirespiratoraceae bacterium]